MFLWPLWGLADITPPLASRDQQRLIDVERICKIIFGAPLEANKKAGSDRLDPRRNIAQGIEKYNILKNKLRIFLNSAPSNKPLIASAWRQNSLTLRETALSVILTLEFC